MGHHRRALAAGAIITAGATLNLRAEARFPAAPPLSAADTPQPVALLPVATPRRDGPLAFRGSTRRMGDAAAKWCRYGFFSEDGLVFTPTRVL